MSALLLDPTPPAPTRSAGADLLAAASRMAAEIDERAIETDAQRAVPDDLVARMRDEGLFHMLLPSSLGGRELDPVSATEVIEALSRADGSTGWTVMIGNSPGFFAWLDPEVAGRMIGEPERVMASAMFGPMGRAVPDGEGGYVLDGRWSFNSSCVHAQWHMLGAMIMDGDMPRFRADGQPDWRFMYVSHDDVELIETWDAGGLRATSSHDLVATGVRVPDEHTAMPMFDPARHDGPLWRLSFWSILGGMMAGVPLGIARRALDELAVMAPKKSRGGPGPTLAEDGHVQVRYGQVEAGLLAARALLRQTIGEAWAIACRGGAPDPDVEARAQVAVRLCMRAAVEAVDFAYTTAGGSAAYCSHPLQRCFRDVHTATQHLAFHDDGWKGIAKLRFGVA